MGEVEGREIIAVIWLVLFAIGVLVGAWHFAKCIGWSATAQFVAAIVTLFCVGSVTGWALSVVLS